MSSPAGGALPRLQAARAIQGVLDGGQALEAALEPLLAPLTEARDRALARRLCHALLRDWPAIDYALKQLLRKPLARRVRTARFVLAIGLAELRQRREPDHAVVHCAVEAARLGGFAPLAGLVNAVLRNYLRRRESLEPQQALDPVLRWGYPGWLIEQIRADWPAEWECILEAGNQPPPLVVRVNRRYWTREQARTALHAAGVDSEAPPLAADALILDRHAHVSSLPGFAEGGLSVQDGAAQRAVEHLELVDGLRVLDACAAPGGKAAHILERARVDLTALEVDPPRLERMARNLERLGLSARCRAVDATRPDEWWDGHAFDRILIDAPCSATGVIRRHPDIRWLRKPADLNALVATQRALLDALWPLLAPGGILVYATCSLLRAENERQAASFVERYGHIEVIEQAEQPGRACAPGRQILPGEAGMDGFYYLSVRRLPGRAARRVESGIDQSGAGLAGR